MSVLRDRYEIDPNTGCWLWTGGVSGSGYGRFREGGVEYQAHRAAWEERFGAIPDGKLVRHRCDTPLCVNADHLLLGTHAENNEDARARGRVRDSDACKMGHPFTPENTYTRKDGRRECVACRRATARKGHRDSMRSLPPAAQGQMARWSPAQLRQVVTWATDLLNGTHIPSSPQPRRQTGVCRVDFDDDGERVDDVAITGDLIEMFRLEAMDRDQFWANVSMLDGRDLRFWFDGSKARSLKVTAEWEGPHTDAEPEDADGEIPE